MCYFTLLVLLDPEDQGVMVISIVTMTKFQVQEELSVFLKIII